MAGSANSDRSPSILLDAAAPLMQPRELDRRLPDVLAGRVDALLASAGAIEDFHTTLEVVGKWLENDPSPKHKTKNAPSTADNRPAQAAADSPLVPHLQ